MSREQNRAEMPKSAELIDMVREKYPDAKVLWVKEGERELGRRPALEPGLVEFSAEAHEAIVAQERYAQQTKGRKRG